MSKNCTLSKSLQLYEDKNKQNASEVEVIKLNAHYPPIDKLEPTAFINLTNCVQLSLSTNCIEKMVLINGMPNLKILSLSRNVIKKITGLDEVGETLKELWLSYNNIDKLDGIFPSCKVLKVLYIAQNKIKDINEWDKINEISTLDVAVFKNNDFYNEDGKESDLPLLMIINKLPQLTMVDGVIITESHKKRAEELNK